MQVAIGAAERVAGDRIERAERLVHQHQPRPAGERPRDADPLRLAARQLARIAAARLGGQRDQLEQLGDPRLASPRRSAGATMPTFSATVMCGNRPSPGRHSRCRGAARARGVSRTSRPSIRTVPASGSIRRLIDLSRVVLPEPDGPTRATNCARLDRQADVIRAPARAPWRLVRPCDPEQRSSAKAWWARQGLNLRPPRCEHGALPLSYAPTPGAKAAQAWQVRQRHRRTPFQPPALRLSHAAPRLPPHSGVDRILEPLAGLELGLGRFLDLHRLAGARVAARSRPCGASRRRCRSRPGGLRRRASARC